MVGVSLPFVHSLLTGAGTTVALHILHLTWPRVKPPPGLRLEVIQEPMISSVPISGDRGNLVHRIPPPMDPAWQDPGYTTFRAMTGNLFNVQPKLRVLSDSGPVNGPQPAVNMKSSCIEITVADGRRS